VLFCFKLTPQKLEIRKDYPHKCLFVKYIIYIKYTCVMQCFLFWRFNGNICYTLKIFTFFIQYARSFRHLVFICYMLWGFSSTKYSMFDLWHCVLQHYIVEPDSVLLWGYALSEVWTHDRQQSMERVLQCGWYHLGIGCAHYVIICRQSC